MKYLTPILIIISSIYYSCGSGSYDLEEVGRTDTVATKSGVQPDANYPPPETVSVPSRIEPKVTGPFTIQIGAFISESNAINLVDQAKNLLGTNIYYRLENGLFKVRVGEFEDLSDALMTIQKVKDSGFPDAFITKK